MKTLFALTLMLLLAGLSPAADSTIHGLPAKAAPDDTDVTVIDDGLNNWKATVGSLRGSSAGTTIQNVYITSNFVSYQFVTNLFATTVNITTNYVNYSYVTNFNGKYTFTTYHTNNYFYTTNVLATYITNQYFYSTNAYISFLTNQYFYTTNVLANYITNIDLYSTNIYVNYAYITNLYTLSLQGIKGYIVLASPFDCDGTGTKIYTNDNSKTYFGQAQFNNSADQTANYCDYYITVPEDFDSAIDLKVERFKFQLSAADTGTHRYVISLSSVADSAAYAGSLGNSVNLDFAGDASGAQGDVETVANVTLTNWKSNMTKGQLLVIRVARDGNDAADTSTVDSYSGPIVISYGVKQ